MSNSYRPLSMHDSPDPRFDTLHDGVPVWMMEPLKSWLREFIWDNGPRLDFVELVEMRFRREPFSRGGNAPGHAIESLMHRNRVFMLDVTDFALSLLGHHQWAPPSKLAALQSVLHSSGSVWEVTLVDKQPRLTRRDLAAAKDAIADLLSDKKRPGQHLAEAWSRIAVRDPDPAAAYDHTVKAIEAAMHPVVQPNHAKATLGTMLGELRAHPDRWAVTLGDTSLVTSMAAAVWQEHRRHGTDGRPAQTVIEADAAIHLAIPLVRLFTGGMVVRSRA